MLVNLVIPVAEVRPLELRASERRSGINELVNRDTQWHR